MSKAVGTKTISQIKNFYYDYKKQSGKSGGKAEKKGSVKESSKSKAKTSELSRKDEKNQSDESMASERGKSPPSASELAQNPKTNPNAQSMTPPPHVVSSTQPQVTAEVQHMIEQRHQELLRMHQQELEMQHAHGRLQDSLAREAESQSGPSRSATSPIPGTDIAEALRARTADYPGGLQNSEMIQQLLKQQHNQQLELQLRQQEQQLHHQRQQQQHHPPQSALHQFLARHQQREQPQHQASQHSHEDARRRIEQHPQQQSISNMFPAWSSASQLLQAHHAPYAAARQQEGGAPVPHESGSTTDSQSEIANLQRFLQMQQMQQQNPMLSLGQPNHSNPLTSLMALTSSGSGISPTLLARIESLSNANRNPSQADQQASEISALINAQSLLGYANGATGAGGPSLRGGGGGVSGNYSAAVDGSHSPRNLPPQVSEQAMALFRAIQRENGGTQHGFGGHDRQG